MAEARCPMCGRVNPAELEVCQFCEARLKPLTRPLSGGGPEKKEPDDWLGALRDEDEKSDESWLESEGDELLDEDDMSDSLDRIGGLEAAQPEDMPDRIDRAEDAPEADEGQPAPASEDIDLAAWLASLDEEGGEQPVPEETAEADLPDWLSQFGESGAPGIPGEANVSGEASASQVEDVPEPSWAFEGDELSEKELTTPAGSDGQLEEELPAWLTDIGAATGSAEVEAQGAEALPDWLSAEAAEVEASASPLEIETPMVTGEEQVPDWLIELEGIEETIEVPVDETTGDIVPDSEEESAATAEGQAFEPDTIADLEAEVPDWLVELEVADRDEVEAELPIESAIDTGDTLSTGELPPWLADFRGEEGEERDSLTEARTGELGDDWLSEIAGEMSFATSEGEQAVEDDAAQAALFSQDDELDEKLREMYLAEEPDWLADVTDAEGQAGGEEGEAELADLAHAQLPGWLEAMRPVGAVVTPQPQVEEEGEFESTGPLAGLRDVLPLGAGAVPVRKPDALTVKLDVTDSQQKHIKLLDELLQAEEAPRLLPKAPTMASQNALRILIGLILIVTTFLAIRAGSQDTALPLPAPEVRDANRLVSGLAPQSPVLLVFDYEPGLAGEMDSVARTVVDHLMLRGVDLTLVSTTPSGPLLAERAITYLGSKHVYTRGEEYVNLGFLPGGPAGVQGLTQFQIRFILPYALGEMENYDPWSTPQRPLSKVTRLNDYAMLVVITDRQENARAWIEQAGPVLAETPLILVTSAQLEPLVRPYYEGRPRLVSGYLSGLAGGAAYERLLGIAGQARLFWDTYRLGAMVSAAVIALGALLNLLAATISRDQPDKGKRSNEPA